MTTDRTNDLIERWLDGVLDDADVAELEAMLLESADARSAFWERANFNGLLREAAKMRFDGGPGAIAGHSVVRAEPRPSAWMRRALTLAMPLVVIGGCGVASIVTTMARSSLTPQAGLVCHEEGFESPPAPATDYVPTVPGIWSGDETEVVEAERGIRPHAGRKMLRFVSCHPRDDVYPGGASEIWRIVDLAALGLPVRSEGHVFELSASFNGVTVSDRTIPACSVAIVATSVDPNSLQQPWFETFSATAAGSMNVSCAHSEEIIDDDPDSWQRLSAIVTAPAGARYLLLHCHVEGRPLNGEATWKPSGQYIDDVRLSANGMKAPSQAAGDKAVQGGAR